MTAPPWRRPPRNQFPGIPAWGLSTTTQALREEFDICRPESVTPEWAWGGAAGEAIRVCVLDSGIDVNHPLIGPVEQALTVIQPDPARAGHGIVADTSVDHVGHGTACIGLIQSLAPAARVTSLRVLTEGITGTGDALIAGLEWAIDEGFDLINLSLSTTRNRLEPALRELADRAYFRRCSLVVAAHNMPVLSYPWTFSAVISVACHDEPDESVHYYNSAPPVEFYARGVRVTVPWAGKGEKRVTGNSFATPHITAICARILSKHPSLTPFQLKSVLYLTAKNVIAATGGAYASQ